jgi:hypothetical protein
MERSEPFADQSSAAPPLEPKPPRLLGHPSTSRPSEGFPQRRQVLPRASVRVALKPHAHPEILVQGARARWFNAVVYLLMFRPLGLGGGDYPGEDVAFFVAVRVERGAALGF